MIKILYGVQGTGNGHLTRARAMAEVFKKNNMDVTWVFSGRAAKDFFDMEIFGDYRLFKGMTFVTERGQVKMFKTVLNLDFKQMMQDVRSLDLSDYDLVVNDFEPVSAWAAKIQKKPVIGISHQNAFLYSVPKTGFGLSGHLFMRFFAPVSVPIGLHWHPYSPHILPPMVEHRPHNHIKMGEHFLVYLPFCALEDFVPVLQAFPDKKFEVYHAVSAPQIYGNVRVNPFSRADFQNHLHQCQGVICGAGFELPSEALHLGKRLLVMPLKGQAEQLSNGIALQSLGLAKVIHHLNPQALIDWFDGPQAPPKCYPDVAQALVEWMLEYKGQHPEYLHARLWGDQSHPALSLY